MRMNLFVGVKVIGIFALVIGSLISAMTGGLLSAIAGFFLTSILITSVLPSDGSKKFNISNLRTRMPRIELIQRIGGIVGVIGCWMLAVMGGWEFVPAGIVLTISMLMAPIVRFIAKRRRGENRVGTGILELNNQLPTTSTVQIVKELPSNSNSITSNNSKSNPNLITAPEPSNTTSISINDDLKIQTPIPNQTNSPFSLSLPSGAPIHMSA